MSNQPIPKNQTYTTIKVTSEQNVTADEKVAAFHTLGGTLIDKNLVVKGSITAHGGTIINGNQTITGNLDVTGTLTAGTIDFVNQNVENLTVENVLTVDGTSDFTGDATFANDVDVSGTLTTASISFSSIDSLTVVNDVSIGTTLDVDGATTLSSTLGVTGATTFSDTTDSSSTTTGALKIAGGLGVAKTTSTKDLLVTDTIAYTGTSAVSFPILNVTTSATIEDLTVNGTLSIDDITLDTLTVNNIATFDGSTTFNADVTASSGLKTDDLIGVGDSDPYLEYNTTTNTLSVTDDTGSTSTTTGALIVAGGLGVAKTIYTYDLDIGNYANIGNRLDVTNSVTAATIKSEIISSSGGTNYLEYTGSHAHVPITTDSTSTTTGALTVAGGLGVAGTTYLTDAKVTDTTDSTSTTTGALTVAGGLGVAGTTYLTDAKVTDTTDSTSTTTGALTVAGGLGVAGTAHIENLTVNGTLSIDDITLDTLTVNNIATFDGSTIFNADVTASSGLKTDDLIGVGDSDPYLEYNTTSNTLSVTDTTSSTSTTSGALTVAGGLGVAETIYTYDLDIGNYANIGNRLDVTNSVTAATIKSEIISSSGGTNYLEYTGSHAHVPITTDSSSTTTGALTVAGGLGVEKTIYAEDLNIANDADVTGSLTAATLISTGNIHASSGEVNAATLISAGNIHASSGTVSAAALTASGAMNSATAVISSTTDSTSTTTGATTIAGGLGVAKTIYAEDVNVDNDLAVSGTTASASTTTGALTVAGGVGIDGNIHTNGYINTDTRIEDTITPDDDINITIFGDYLTISYDGDYAAFYQLNGSDNEVVICNYSGGSWSIQQTLTDNPTVANFGNSLSFNKDADRLAVGGFGANKVYIYSRSGSTWSLMDTINGVGTPSVFGKNVELSHDGTTVIIADNGVNSIDGAIYVFDESGGSWTITATCTSGTTALSFGDGGIGFAKDTADVLVGHAGHIIYFFNKSGTWSTSPDQTIDTSGANLTGISMNAVGTTMVVGTSNDKFLICNKNDAGTWSLDHAVESPDIGLKICMSGNGDYIATINTVEWVSKVYLRGTQNWVLLDSGSTTVVNQTSNYSVSMSYNGLITLFADYNIVNTGIDSKGTGYVTRGYNTLGTTTGFKIGGDLNVGGYVNVSLDSNLITSDAPVGTIAYDAVADEFKGKKLGGWYTFDMTVVP